MKYLLLLCLVAMGCGDDSEALAPAAPIPIPDPNKCQDSAIYGVWYDSNDSSKSLEFKDDCTVNGQAYQTDKLFSVRTLTFPGNEALLNKHTSCNYVTFFSFFSASLSINCDDESFLFVRPKPQSN